MFAQQIMMMPSSEGSSSQNRSARFGGRNEQTSSFNAQGAQSTVKKENKKNNVENIAPEVNKQAKNKQNNM